jgi:RimJ/RimL family protein N-acetyltransferase
VTGAASLRRGGVEDILYIMATERRPGYDLIVGRWTEAAHLAAIVNPAYAYLVGTDAAGGSAGFVILRDLDDPHSNVCLKRIAVEQPGRGFGSTLLRLALSWTFSETLAHRIWLEVVADNSRARHVYAAAGFVEEGLLRQAWLLPDGGRIDLILMSVLRADWLQQARLTAGSAPIEE